MSSDFVFCACISMMLSFSWLCYQLVSNLVYFWGVIIMYADINDLSCLQRINNCQHSGCLEKELVFMHFVAFQYVVFLVSR
jgi:hypothetical protein